MPIDYSKIPTEDLEAISTGDLTKVSTASLKYLSSNGTVGVMPEAEMTESPRQPSPREQVLPESTVGKFVAGVGGGMTHLAEGAKQRYLEKFGDPQESKKYNEHIENMRKVDKALMDTTSGNIGEMVGQAAALAPIPGGANALLARLGLGVGAGALTGYLQPTTKDESPATNALVGGAAGGAGAGAIAGGSKIFNAIKGPVKNATQKLSEKYEIPLTLGEIKNNPIIKRVETWGENIPFVGLKGFREKQQKASEKAAKSFMAKYIVNPDSTDIMNENRAFTSRLYESLKSKVAQVTDQEIPPVETRKAAFELLDRYPDIFKKFQDTKREGIIQDIISSIDTEIGPRNLTFDEAWSLRQGLGEMIGQARRKLAAGDVDQTTLGQVKKLFGSVNDDIENWTSSIGRQDIKTAIETANESYKTYVVKYDILQRAMDKATGEVGAGEMFSPKKFSTALKNIAGKEKYLKTFSKTEVEEMSGIANIMQIAKRGGQYAENPPTGNRWGPLYAVAGEVALAVHSPAAAGGVAGIGILTKFLTSTSSGKAFAMAASKIEPDSPAMAHLMKQLYSSIPKISALSATKKIQENGDE